MAKVLVVEDTKMFSRMLGRKIQALGFDVAIADTLAMTREKIGSTPEQFFLALLDLNLPDAPNGEVVDYVLGQKIPAIVFTGNFSDELREQMIQKKVVDYVTKTGQYSLDFLVYQVERIHKNRSTKVLLVDDSQTARIYVAQMLAIQQYQVLEASSGKEALKILESNSDIKVVLTDYMMPEMDGFELTKIIRSHYGRDELAVIGMSAHGNNILSARFIKNGASDFITKPFLEEEFYCRINQNVEIIEHIQALRETSVRDFLTGLHNRRYLFDIGEKLFASACRDQINLTVAMMDIDHFKRVNDTYGHETGDVVLKKLAKTLQAYFRETDVVARTGGEEFCLILVNMESDTILNFFQRLRKKIETVEVLCGQRIIHFTVSIGVCTVLTNSLDSMVAEADKLLYQAKESGRNKVVMDNQQHQLSVP